LRRIKGAALPPVSCPRPRRRPVPAPTPHGDRVGASWPGSRPDAGVL